jgi:hypothetical protein
LPNTELEIIAMVEKTYEEYPANKINRLWVTLQLIYNCILEDHGDNKYKLPHMNKAKLEQLRQLPRQLHVDHSALQGSLMLPLTTLEVTMTLNMMMMLPFCWNRKRMAMVAVASTTTLIRTMPVSTVFTHSTVKTLPFMLSLKQVSFELAKAPLFCCRCYPVVALFQTS